MSSNVVHSNERGLAIPPGIIISCQASEGSPLGYPSMMAALARAAAKAGATGIRAEGAPDILEIRAAVEIPVIGIRKKGYSNSDVYITATRADVDLLAGAGVSIIAIDATTRDRPRGETLETVVAHAKTRGLVVMGDLTKLEDAEGAIDAGVDAISTTMVKASDSDSRVGGPNIKVLYELAEAYPAMQIVGEGRYATPEDVTNALTAGATTVVIGKAVTDAYALTMDLVTAASLGLAWDC